MKHVSPADEMLLREIRSAMSPTAAEEGRLRARLGAALGVAVLPTPASLDAPLGPGAGGAVALGSAPAATSLWGSGLRLGIQGPGKQLIAAGIVAASAFGVGYVAGRAESPDRVATSGAGPASVAPPEAPAPPDAPPKENTNEAQAAAVEPGPEATAGEPSGRGEEEATTEAEAARHRGHAGARGAGGPLHEGRGDQEAELAASQTTTDAGGRSASLDEEALQLRRVGRSLRNGHPLLALKILDDLEIRVPKGVLGEERLAARLMARCLVGDRDAPATAVAWLRDHPTSVYAPRVRASCSSPRETTEEESERP